MNDQFKPFDHVPPDTRRHRLMYMLRLATDLQVNTVHRDVLEFAGGAQGTILDIGAGASPYRHLFMRPGVQYVGIDTAEARQFGYDNPAAIQFDGEHLPFESGSVDGFICTEVLEHLPYPEGLVSEMHRVLRIGGRGLVTVPWSARFHYIPYDYQRLTPTALQRLFASFVSADIRARGTDVTVISAKILVLCSRLILSRTTGPLVVRGVLSLALFPIVAAALAIGHLSLRLGLGSADDPLGYSIWVSRGASATRGITARR
jgi:SAM-dependent methyltransferase